MHISLYDCRFMMCKSCQKTAVYFPSPFKQDVEHALWWLLGRIWKNKILHARHSTKEWECSNQKCIQNPVKHLRQRKYIRKNSFLEGFWICLWYLHDLIPKKWENFPEWARNKIINYLALSKLMVWFSMYQILLLESYNSEEKHILNC